MDSGSGTHAHYVDFISAMTLELVVRVPPVAAAR